MVFVFWSLFSIVSSAHAEDLVRTATWDRVPIIEICPDATITKEAVLRAMAYWLEVTGETLPYTSISYAKSCHRRKPKVIRIMDLKDENKLDSNNYAVTYYNYWWYNNNPERQYMENVRVMIPKETRFIPIIAHELGHAYGYVHSEHSIMKPYF